MWHVSGWLIEGCHPSPPPDLCFPEWLLLKACLSSREERSYIIYGSSRSVKLCYVKKYD